MTDHLKYGPWKSIARVVPRARGRLLEAVPDLALVVLSLLPAIPLTAISEVPFRNLPSDPMARYLLFISGFSAASLIHLAGRGCLGFGLVLFSLLELFLAAEVLSFSRLHSGTAITYACFFALLGIALLKIRDLLPGRAGMALAFPVLSLLPLSPVIHILHSLKFGAPLGQSSAYALFQTTPYELMAKVLSPDLVLWCALLFAAALLFGWVSTLSLFLGGRRVSGTTASAAVVILLFGAASKTTTSSAPVLTFRYGDMLSYKRDLESFREFKRKVSSLNIPLKAEKPPSPDGGAETYVFVLGESLNKEHMGLYGHHRKTNPRLGSHPDLLLFDNAYSNHTHSVQSISLMLTEANQYNGRKYHDSPNIVQILNASGFETFWITNQVLYGVWDNPTTVVAECADHLTPHNPNRRAKVSIPETDEVVLESFEGALARTGGNKAVFVHLMGNHAPHCDRVPEGLPVPGPLITRSHYGLLADTVDKKFVDCYDKSVLYNDLVMDKILGLLRKANGPRALLYVPDHSENVYRGTYNNEAVFTFPMTAIPMVAWFSDEYRELYPEKVASLEGNLDTLFSNDLIYDTLVGIAGVRTDRYEESFDLSSKAFDLPEDKALVLHGKRKYLDPENRAYIQKRVSKGLLSRGEGGRILPHRVNSLGKLGDIWRDGHRSFEVDVLFETPPGRGRPCLHVGHDRKRMSGICLSELLPPERARQAGKIWLDFKNLDPGNMNAALLHMRGLDGLADKLIVETYTTWDGFRSFSDAGFRTMYCLPTDRVLGARGDRKLEERIARSILGQLDRQKVRDISFREDLYPFVKERLEPLLSASGKRAAYHVWVAADAPLWDIGFSAKIQARPYHGDPRVETVLVPYHSEFNL